MRKALTFLLILVLLFSLGAGYAIKAVHAPVDRVVFTQETLWGDPAAADGLTVIKEAQYKEHLLWKSALSFKDSTYDTHTDFSYVPESYFENFYQPSYGVFAADLTTDAYFDNTYDSPQFTRGFAKAQKELYYKTPVGTTGTMAVKTSDYYDYYPLQVEITLPELSYWYSEEMAYADKNTDPQTYAILSVKEFLKIPVLADEAYQISMDKDFDGGASYVGFETDERFDSFCPYADSTITDKACYFWFSNRTTMGNRVDCSEIPGGYGLYILPYGEIKADNYRGQEHFEGYDVFADELRLFYPLPEDTDILHLSISDDQSTLLLHTLRKGYYTVTAIDAESGRTLSSVGLYENASFSEDVWDFNDQKTFFTVLRNRTLTLLTLSENQTVNIEISADSEDIDHNGTFLSPYGGAGRVMAYDGERLVLAADGGDDGSSLGFLLTVFTRDGLQYCGLYQSSLQKVLPSSESYSYRYAASGSYRQKILFPKSDPA